MKVKYLFRVFVPLLCFTISLVILTWGSFPTGNPPPSTKNAPVYPNAIGLTIDSISVVNVKSYSFETNDRPEDVKNYYKNNLEKDGWVERDVPMSAGPYSSRFTWADNVSIYELQVTIDLNSSDKKTRVKLELSSPEDA